MSLFLLACPPSSAKTARAPATNSRAPTRVMNKTGPNILKPAQISDSSGKSAPCAWHPLAGPRFAWHPPTGLIASPARLVLDPLWRSLIAGRSMSEGMVGRDGLVEGDGRPRGRPSRRACRRRWSAAGPTITVRLWEEMVGRRADHQGEVVGGGTCRRGCMTSSVFFYRRYSKDVKINIINEWLPIFVYAAVAEWRKHPPVPGAKVGFFRPSVFFLFAPWRSKSFSSSSPLSPGPILPSYVINSDPAKARAFSSNRRHDGSSMRGHPRIHDSKIPHQNTNKRKDNRLLRSRR
jgi:hypothetical protein